MATGKNIGVSAERKLPSKSATYLTASKQALKEKLQESGLEEQERKQVKPTLSNDEKEEMKKKIAQAEQERFEKLDKKLHSRESKKKKRK